MPLILAIEPDRNQAARLAALAPKRIDAELLVVANVAAALAALDVRVPDLVLTPSLLSPRDDAALAARLRELDTRGFALQTLVIPLLAGDAPAPSEPERAGGLLNRIRKPKPAAPASAPDGCDPAVFAAQVNEYLERSAAEKRDREEAARSTDWTSPRVTASAPMLGELLPLATPGVENLPAASMELVPVDWSDQAITFEPGPELAQEPQPEPQLTPDPMLALVQTSQPEPMLAMVPTPEQEPAVMQEPALTVEPEPEAAVPVESMPAFETFAPVDLLEAIGTIPHASVHAAHAENPEQSIHAAPAIGDADALRVTVDIAALAATPSYQAAGEAPQAPPPGHDAPPIEEQDPPPSIPAGWAELESFIESLPPASDAALRTMETVEASPAFSSSPALEPAADRSAHLPEPPLSRSRPKRHRLKAAPRTGSGASVAPAAPAADSTATPSPSRPTQDEWGLYDPEQCGFAALLHRLDEITSAGTPKPKRRKRSAIMRR